MTSRRAELWCKSNCTNQPRHMPGRLAPFPARRRAMLLNQSTGDSYTHAAILACASAVKRSTAAVISGA
jgi:hypothetical protein